MAHKFFVFLFLTSFVGLLSCQQSRPYSLSIGVPLPIPPLPPSAKTFASTTTDAYLTPFVMLGEGAKDRSRLGLKNFQAAVGSTRCGNDVSDWSDLSSSPVIEGFNLFFQTPFILGNTYYISVRSVDNYNQYGEPLCLDGFLYTDVGWKNSAYIKPSNANSSSFFGWNISIDGDTMVVSSPFESSDSLAIVNGDTSPTDTNRSHSGAVYIFRKTAGVWVQEAYLKAPNADVDDQFGYLTAISGDTVAVVANLEDSNALGVFNGTSADSNNSRLNAGAVYVFRRTAGIWSQEAYIKSFNTATLVSFGTSVALNNDTLVVGGHTDSNNLSSVVNGVPGSFDNGSDRSGAVFVFKRTGVNWAPEAYLKASNNSSLNFFGGTVSIDGDTIAVGALHESSNYTGIINGSSASSDRSAPSSGAVYIFTRSSGLWSQTAYIKSNVNFPDSEFGTSLSLKGNRLAVGVPKESGTGAVYIFQNIGGVWSQETKILASNQADGDEFGTSVAIENNLLLVGAPNESSCVYTIENAAVAPDYGSSCAEGGAAYIYTNASGSWVQEAYAKPSNLVPAYTVKYGTSVAISLGQVAVGGYLDYGNQNYISNPGESPSFDLSLPYSGAVYVLEK